ncbi:rho guanine nucleotide exchange factor [Elysia marginata]|uniref:Rho guanine nucleotide exchange factor n=1 Tax=Elysia marginata TaxID=1093978 RepID=A0AAV4GC32_9GAST|nr:rho guanine nucleotide exchange factor [Elysia marginata]
MLPCSYAATPRSPYGMCKASSLPTTTSDLGSMSDSPQTSPSVSPTPNDPQRHNGQEMEDSMTGSSNQDIITIDDEDIHSEDDQLFHIIAEAYRCVSGSTKELRKWAYEIYSTFVAQMAPLCIGVDDSIINQIDNILTTSASRTDNESTLRNMFQAARQSVQPEIGELLADFRNKRDLGMANFYGFQKLHDNMDKATEIKVAEELLIPILEAVSEDNNRNVRDRDQAIGWALATFLRSVSGSKSAHSGTLDRVQTFMMKDKRGIKFPGSKSSRAKSIKGHQFTLMHCYVTTFCNYCNTLIWGVGYQGYQCQSCEMTLHKQCVEEITETCGGKQKRRVSKMMLPTVNRRISSNTTPNQSGRMSQQMGGVRTVGDATDNAGMGTQPYPREEETDLAGLPTGHSVKSIINRYELTSPTGPGPGPGLGLEVPGGQGKQGKELAGGLAGQGGTAGLQDRWVVRQTDTGRLTDTLTDTQTDTEADRQTQKKGLISTVRGVSIIKERSVFTTIIVIIVVVVVVIVIIINININIIIIIIIININTTTITIVVIVKGDRPARRAKSDVDVDSDMFKAINQSGSSSASSLSNRSVESPSQSVEGMNSNPDVMRALHEADSDLEVEPELPPLQSVLGDDVLRKLKPKEKKRQEVINELFYTERNHLRNLKVLDLLFNRPMQQERGVKVMFELALALFPNMEEMVALHETLVKDIKGRSATSPVKEVGDLLLKRFDGEAGEKFRKGCAEYCRNQAFALEALKKHTRKEPKLEQFLKDAESNPMCRRLQLKDLVPSQMQRLTKYPLLIDSLMKHTQSHSDEYKHLEQAHEKCKHILAYVNQAVKECENYHKIKDIQRKLDTKSIEANTEDMLEIKNLDLSQHKLIFDGPLTWKLRGHRTVDLHLLLFDDMLVLLQKQDDKYVLKFQSTNAQITRDEHKYSHGPVLRLKNVLARTLATDKKSFFVVNMTDVGAQMYEFTAATSELRIKWCKLINDKVDEVKRQGAGGPGGGPGGPAMRSQSLNQAPKPEKIELERSKTTRISRKNRSVRNPNVGSPSDSPPRSPPQKVKAADDQVDGIRRAIGSVGDGDDDSSRVSELIQPEEVRVDSAVVVEAQAVRSPMELLRQNSELITSALQDQDRLVTEVLRVSGAQTPAKHQQSADTSGEAEKGGRVRGQRKWSRRKSSAVGEDGVLQSVQDGQKDNILDAEEEMEEGDKHRAEQDEIEGEEEESPEVLVAKALQFNARCLQIITEDSLALAQQHVPLTASSPLQHLQQQQQQQQQFAVSEEISSPMSSIRRLLPAITVFVTAAAPCHLPCLVLALSSAE